MLQGTFNIYFVLSELMDFLVDRLFMSCKSGKGFGSLFDQDG